MSISDAIGNGIVSQLGNSVGFFAIIMLFWRSFSKNMAKKDDFIQKLLEINEGASVQRETNAEILRNLTGETRAIQSEVSEIRNILLSKEQ